MVSLFNYKRRTLIIESTCCQKIMRCNDTDLVDWDDIYERTRHIPIKGQCPYCKTKYRDYPAQSFFYAVILDDLDPEREVK